MRRFLIVFVIIIMNLLNLLVVPKGFYTSASSGEWELLTKGFDTGTIYSIAIDPKNPKIVYAGSWGSGIYKSIDGGNNWFKPYEGTPFVDVNNLLIDPNNTDIIYASTFGKGLQKSLDGGKNWGVLKDGTGGFLAMDYTNNKVLYFGAQGGNIYKTEDAGISWKLIKSIEGAGRTSVAVDPKNPSILYAGVEYVGFFKSIDGGVNWNLQNSGITNVRILSLAVDPVNSQNIYIGTIDYGIESGGIFKSTNGGTNWTRVFNNGGIWSIAINPKNTNIVYGALNCCGILKSTNSGFTWEKIDSPDIFILGRTIAINPVDTNILFAGSWGGGVHKSVDGGKSWVESSFGMNDVQTEYFAINPKDDSVYILVEEKGIFKTSNGGQSWEKKNGSIDYYHWGRIFIDPIAPNTLYALRWCCGIFKTTNGGESWTNLSSKWDNNKVCDLAIDPNNHLVLYTGIYEIWNPNGTYLGVLKSEDSGLTWRSIGLKNYEITEIEIDPVSKFIYVGTTKGLFRSEDQGKTWKDLNLPYNIYSIAIDTKNSPNVIYVGTDGNGGFKTTDGGKTWVNTGLGDAGIFIINPSDSNIIYEGTWCSGGVYRSTDGGKTWTNLPGLDCVYHIELDPNNPKTVYVSTRSGLYKYITKYSISARTGIGGVISPSGTNYFKDGEAQSFSFTANEGYRLKDVKVDNVSVGAVSSYTLSNINADHTIEAVFEPITFTITATASFGGSISPQGSVVVNYGESKTFYISSEIGYKIGDVKVDGISIGPVSNYFFYKVTVNHAISVTFEDARITLILQIGKDYFTVNGVKKILDSPPVIKNGRTLLPIRAIIEALGGTVVWAASTKIVDVNLDNNFIRLQIGNAIASVNDEEKIIDPANYKVVPEIINGRTMLPLRFVAENLGCDVQWDDATKTITIIYTED